MEETVKQIPLRGSDTPAIVDDSDYDLVIGSTRRTWRLTPTGYAEWCTRKNYKTVHYQMANVIMGRPKAGYMWDHRDRDPLNNQRSNLRLATNVQNLRNMAGRSKSGFKGVYRVYDHAKEWESKLSFQGKVVRVGYFDTPLEAALAYDVAAKKYFGEFAYLNFPSE